MVVACGVTSVYLVYRLGKEAFSRPVGLLAALFLAVEPLHVRYSHVAVTDVPATMFGLLALLLFVRAARLGSARSLLYGALAAGLATGTKYNLGMLVRARRRRLLVRLSRRPERSGPAPWRSGARALRRVAAPMFLAFLVSTPFALLDPPHFLGDFVRQNHIVANGWLGFENVHNGYWYNLSVNLLGSLGVVLLALGLIGLVLALARRTRADYILVPYVLVYYLYVSSWHALMDRYLLPIVPLLIVLAVRACVRALPRCPWCAGAAVRRGRRCAPAAGRHRAAGASLDQLLALAQRHRRAHGGQGLDRAPSAGQRGDRHGARRAAARVAPRPAASTPRPGSRRASYQIYTLPLPLPGVADPTLERASPDRRRGRLRGAELRRRRQGAAPRAATYPRTGGLLPGARAPRAGGRELHAAPRRARPGDHGLPAAAGRRDRRRVTTPAPEPPLRT